MPDYMILWSYASVWTVASGNRSSSFEAGILCVEQDAYDRVMEKVRAATPSSAWASTQRFGYC